MGDVLMYVTRWPMAVSSNPPANVPSFVLHGLWPNNDDGSYPSNCNPRDRFSWTALEPIMSELAVTWPDLQHPGKNASGFWQHEWSKHGTCAINGQSKAM